MYVQFIRKSTRPGTFIMFNFLFDNAAFIEFFFWFRIFKFSKFWVKYSIKSVSIGFAVSKCLQ